MTKAPLFEHSAFAYKVKVYPDYIEARPLFGKKIIPISKIADIDVPVMSGFTGFINLVLNSGEVVQIQINNSAKRDEFIALMGELLGK